MGIENRDYYRESNPYTDRLSGWGIVSIPPVCKWIIIANIAVFVLQIFVTREPTNEDVAAYKRKFEEMYKGYGGLHDRHKEKLTDAERAELEQAELESYQYQLGRMSYVEEWLRLETAKVIRGQVWRFLTCAFCHDRMSVWHLVVNMLFLYWFGVTLESMYGSREFLLFYLAAAIFASLAYVGLDLATGESRPAIGASGAVMAVTMLFAIFYPRHIIYVFFIIPFEVRWLVVVYVIFDLHPVLLALAGYPSYSGVAHAAHLGGLAFGFLYWKLNWRLAPFFERLPLPRWDRTFGPRRGIRLFRSGDGRGAKSQDAEVDDILRKIHEQGEASLTDRERQVLTSASKRYQRRNG